MEFKVKAVDANVEEKSRAQVEEALLKEHAEQFENQPLFELEYFTIADEETLKSAPSISPEKTYRAFIAVYAREVRLIDTISLNS